jgi:hypothetical protein
MTAHAARRLCMAMIFGQASIGRKVWARATVVRRGR